ncbi:putative Glycoside hydrolase family 28 protein [Seiridium unicorne]|uniref:galacturonan 1,4-alpha-galacturonidase n=1 Tax=Seiridium unicorne TaxID=138068 RepID=A0ABR2UGA1_9PEZI
MLKQNSALALLAALTFCSAQSSNSYVDVDVVDGKRVCTVTSIGNNQSDVGNILYAFCKCRSGSTIIFPEDQNYWIGERLHAEVHDVNIEWKGQWTLSDDLDYWRNNSYPIAFQNHHAGFILSGDGLNINGYGTGGINGNGEAWYDDEAGTTLPGRPMSFVLWNVSDVQVSSFFLKQSPLWGFNIMNGTNLKFTNLYAHNVAPNAPSGANWVQNTDGFDTMDVNNVTLDGLDYTGGDDCIAIKPRSYNMTINNVTCHGGNGIAIGSLGQYEEDSSVENVILTNIAVPGTRYGTYIKTWIGYLVPQASYESAGQPRGGGWGTVRNLTFENVDVTGAASAISITQDNGNNGSYSGTSKMLIDDINFINFTGTLTGSSTINVSCSEMEPCYDICFEDLTYTGTTGANPTGSCNYTASGGIHGLTGC